MTTNTKARSNMKRIQYTTQDKSASSMTIDPEIYEAVNIATNGNGSKWFQFTASEMRAKLEEEGQEQVSKGFAKSVEEFVCGKVSAKVRKEALRLTLDPQIVSRMKEL